MSEEQQATARNKTAGESSIAGLLNSGGQWFSEIRSRALLDLDGAKPRPPTVLADYTWPCTSMRLRSV